MANTIMSAKNSFQDGLILDFSPENTSATSMTAALNATLITFNGNEMALQNDMGNGRVETAFLPEGYVPVGTCEFGDIIYIVSYNPLLDKSQIGCFPSPERNISTEEIGGLKQSLSWNDFQETNDNINPNGKLKTASVKKIIYSKGLNPGDKYIIYASRDLERNSNNITDYGNSERIYGANPKFLRIHIVSIEDSGKINFLDSTVKWYNNNYFIQTMAKDQVTLSPDIDSYRSLVSSAYTTFQSKISGKLALLIELEKINTFDCSYTVYPKESKDSSGNPKKDALGNFIKDFYVYFNISWKSLDNKINPQEVIISDLSWPRDKNGLLYYKENTGQTEELYYTSNNKYNWTSGNNRYSITINAGEKTINEETVISLLQKKENELPVEGRYYINPQTYSEGKYYNGGKVINDVEIKDNIINNIFEKPVTKHAFTLANVPFKDSKGNYYDLSNFIANYSLIPAMPYGALEDLKVSGTIDFSKVGTGFINLKEWHYYNDGNISTLKWGMEAYPEEGKQISQVSFSFYDNNGLAAVYNVSQKDSYSGTFTEVIQLGAEGSNPNLSIYDINGNIITHPGYGPLDVTSVDQETLNELITNKIYIKRNNAYYINDAGCLYPNFLYYVIVTVKYQQKDELGNFITGTGTTKEFYRYYWTNTLMNRYYYNNLDFINVSPEIEFSLDSVFSSNSNFDMPLPEGDLGKYVIDKSSTQAQPDSSTIITDTMGCMRQTIQSKNTNQGNLTLNIYPQLNDSYGSFAFDEAKLQYINYTIGFSNEQLSNTSYDIKYSDRYPGTEALLIGPNIINRDNDEESYISQLQEISSDYSTWEDWFSLKPVQSKSGNPNIKYYNTEGEEHNTTENYQVTIDALEAYRGIAFNLQGALHSKIAASTTSPQNIDAIVYKPIITSSEDFSKYNISYSPGGFYFQQLLTTGQWGDKDPGIVLSTASSTGQGFGTIQLNNIDIDSDKVSQVTNINIGQACLDKSIDAGMFSLLTFWCFSDKDTIEDIDNSPKQTGDYGDKDNRDGSVELFQNDTNKSVKSWQNNWVSKLSSAASQSMYCLRRPEKEKTQRDNTSLKWGTDLQSSINTLAALVVKNSNGYYTLYNNFCSFYPRSGSDADQRFSYKNGSALNGCYTTAQMVASLLSKIYIKSSETEPIEDNQISNIITCSNYNWNLNKDIVISTNYSGDNKSLLSLNGINYKEYYNQLSHWISSNTKDNSFNILINLNKVHTIQFEYQVPYNINYLEKKYQSISTSQKFVLVKDIVESSSKGNKSLTEPPFEGNFAFLTDDEIFVDKPFYKEAFSNAHYNLSIPTLTTSLSNSDNKLRFDTNALQNIVVNGNDIEFSSNYTGSTSNPYRLLMIGGNTKDTLKKKCWITMYKDNKFINLPELTII